MSNFKFCLFLLGILLTGTTFAQTYVNVFDFMTAQEIADVKAGTKNYDVTSAIEDALDSFQGSTPQGILYFPAGVYKISSTILLPGAVGLKGESFRASKLDFVGTGPIITWATTTVYDVDGMHIEDLWLNGTGVGVDSTNDGILFQHSVAFKFPVLKNLYITNCGGYGINTYQNGFESAHFDSIHVDECANGMLLGGGFSGSSQMDNLMFEDCGIGLKFGYVTGFAATENIIFTNLRSHLNDKGIVFNGPTDGVIKFINGHIEANDTYGVEFAHSDARHVVFDNCWFANNPTAVYGSQGGLIEFVSCHWEAPNATYRWVHLINSSNFRVHVSGFQWEGITLNTPLQAVDIAAIRGNMVRKAATTGAFSQAGFCAVTLQSRSINSEYITVQGNNLTGKMNIGSGDSSILVTFARAETDASYNIVGTVDRSTYTSSWHPGISIGNKTTTGFRVYFSSSAPSTGYVFNWILAR